MIGGHPREAPRGWRPHRRPVGKGTSGEQKQEAVSSTVNQMFAKVSLGAGKYARGLPSFLLAGATSDAAPSLFLRTGHTRRAR
jgi:hypothetical protein